MKTMKRILSGIMATAMVCAAGMTGAFAAPIAQIAAKGPTVNMTKFLIIDKTSTVPTVNFEFNVKPGEASNAATNNPISEGLMPTTPPTDVKAIVSFGPASTTADGATVKDYTTNPPVPETTADQKYATGTATFDFSQISYPAPGIYRYLISEKNDGVPSIEYDTEVYALDIFVGYADSEAESKGELSILGYGCAAFETAEKANESPALMNKSGAIAFPNKQDSADLSITKEVTGNLGDKSKYFTFTVNLTGVAASDSYNVDLTGASNTSNPKTISGNKDTVFYLKHGETIVLKGLPVSATYTVTEDDYTSDGYTTTSTVTGGTDTDTSDRIISSTIVKGSNVNTFTNDKQQTTPTGVLLNILPFALLMLLAAGGLAFFVRSKKHAR